MWNTISVGHGPLCLRPLSVTVCDVLNLCRSRSVMPQTSVGHGLLCFGPLSLTVCVIFTKCRSRSVMLWTPVGHGLLCFGPLSVTVCYALDRCRSRSVMFTTCRSRSVGGGGGSKFSTLNFNTLFQIVFHKTRPGLMKVRAPNHEVLSCYIKSSPFSSTLWNLASFAEL